MHRGHSNVGKRLSLIKLVCRGADSVLQPRLGVSARSQRDETFSNTYVTASTVSCFIGMHLHDVGAEIVRETPALF